MMSVASRWLMGADWDAGVDLISAVHRLRADDVDCKPIAYGSHGRDADWDAGVPCVVILYCIILI
jgi:hypothetical protein